MEAELDSLAVEAVKNGDSQRYAELVERYEQQVYAVAWSRLGDADLAQEATQEAFIKGFQHLPILNQGAKFSAWITVIARNLAVNLGLRHRNELKKRKRWALEHMKRTSTPSAKDTVEEPVSLETLRETLAELPTKHRECLVLFYLEGKSIAQAAPALGLSETAFKTRLFRARAALRTHLEKRLDTSLAQLRPRHTVVPIVMGLLATGKVKAAGLLGSSTGGVTKVALSVTKLLPFRLFMLGPMLAGWVPGLLFHYYMGQWELKNFRQQEGFRAQSYKRCLIKSVLMTPLLMGTILICMGIIFVLLGKGWIFQILGILSVVYLFAILRQYRINSGRFVKLNLCAMVMYTFTYLAVGFLGVSPEIVSLGVAGGTICLGLAYRYQPRRMDYSLVLRVAKDLIPEVAVTETPRELTEENIWAFAGFLGERWLIRGWRRKTEGIQLRLAAASPSVRYEGFLPLIWYRVSTCTIGLDGHIQVRLGKHDQARLAQLQPGGELNTNTLESRLEGALQGALQAFLQGDNSEAERLLGQEPEQKIFHVAPQKSRAACWYGYWITAVGVLLLALMMYSLWEEKYNYPTQGRRLKAVHVTEMEVRQALGQLTRDPGVDDEPRLRVFSAGNPKPQAAQPVSAESRSYQERVAWKEFDSALRFGCLVFPSQAMFPPQAWANIQQRIQSSRLVFAVRKHEGPEQILRELFVNQHQVLWRAIDKGLWTSAELGAMGLTPSVARQYFTETNPKAGSRLETIREGSVHERDYTILDVEEFGSYLTLLRYLNSLDLVPAKPIIDQLSRHQVLPGHSLENRKPIADRKLLHGLFHCMFSDPFQDTYNALYVLSELNGLEHIDREACIQGILRFHHGKGLFGSFTKNDGLYFTGGTRDTLYAYESLRLLDGLDRVKDLHKWLFRPVHTSRASAAKQIQRQIAWAEIEAWVLTQRLDAYLEARRQNPEVKPQSLRYPLH